MSDDYSELIRDARSLIKYLIAPTQMDGDAWPFPEIRETMGALVDAIESLQARVEELEGARRKLNGHMGTAPAPGRAIEVVFNADWSVENGFSYGLAPVGWRYIDPPEDEQRCRSASDGECFWVGCPQVRDGEPAATGRHCPLDTEDEQR